MPWVCEVHFAYDDDLNLFFRSLKSRRHSKEVDGNSNVAGSIIDKYAIGEEVIGVYFEGNARLLRSDADKNRAYICIKNRLGGDKDILEEADREDGHQFYEVSILKWCVFGRFGNPTGQKYELKWRDRLK